MSGRRRAPLSAEPAVAGARRGRPRSERAHKAILEAAGDLLLQSGLDAAGMDAIAMRAGVSKATIYRWWRTKELLALDAIYHEWTAAHPESAGSGSLRGDLYSMLRPWVKLLNDRPYGRVVAAILAKVQTDAGFAEEYRTRFLDRRRQLAREVMLRAIESGEIAATTNVELALDLLYGPVYHRLLHGHAPLDEPFVRGVVDSVVYGLTSAAAVTPVGDLRPVLVDEVLRLQQQGATVVDARDALDFGRGHLPGAVNIPLGTGFATWCGTVIDRERPVVIVAAPGVEHDAAAVLELVGATVHGFLAGGAQALALQSDRLAAVGRVGAAALAAQLGSPEPPLVVDVRTEQEWHSCRIGASINLPLALLAQRHDRLARDRRLVVYCAEGYRSAIAASLLLRAGFAAVLDLTGGIEAWQASGLETVGRKA